MTQTSNSFKDEELDERMYRLNAKLSAIIHIHNKLLTKEQLMELNREIGEWIKIYRMEKHEND